ncbi:hypothetical protein BD410DRAFT_783028 [Rickenella mellea]|uniref:CCR4-NOT transcription complex subunit 11 n=1 Tax=Rickenella mellea TaxID=50990 RepID=A0A4Y7QJB8_9AGAM|nr:hypothetical protein BD410DRAFT_783028 [Rickenella mellea]
MQAANFHPNNSPTAVHPPGDPVRASVIHLMSKACSLPCTAAALAFNQLVQPTARFQLALDALLPLLSGNGELPQRILVSYILYSLYATHPIAMNPFKIAFAEVFIRERDHAKSEAERNAASENEQLVWVLWKILKGDGNDLGPYSPTTLARSPLPPKLRASQLTFDDEATFHNIEEQYESSEQSPLTNGSSLSPTTSRSQLTRLSPAPKSYTPGHSTPVDETNPEHVNRAKNLLLAARFRVLTLSEQRTVAATLQTLGSNPIVSSEDLPSLTANNPTLAHPLIVSLLAVSESPSFTGSRNAHAYLEVLKQLPPTLPSFDIIGRLLRDITPAENPATGARTTVGELIRSDVLGAFVLNAIGWVEGAEEDEREGLISDDRVSKGVQNLCRFYNSLIKLDIVDPASDADSTEMAHFALSHSRFEEANALYRVLVMGKF